MKKKSRRAVCMTLLLSLLAGISAYGAGPGETGIQIPDGVTEEEWAKLNDSLLEYGELYNQVRYFNTSMQNADAKIQDVLDGIKRQCDGMRRSVRENKDDAKELKDSGANKTMEGMVEYMTLEMTSKIVGSAADRVQRTLNVMARSDSSLNTNLDIGAKTMTSYASQIMIGYNSALSGQATLKKLEELSAAVYETQCLSRQVGMATEADVISAQKDLLSAQSSLMQIDNTVDSLKRSLCLMTGYSLDNMPQIGGLPELDLSVLDAIDLEADTQKAISNSNEVINARHEAAKSTVTMKNREASEAEASQKVAVTMQSLYQDLRQAKTAYDAACVSYEKAVLEKGKADRSYQLKMLGKIQYLQAEMAFLQAEGTKQSAYNSLYQAYTTYQWAVEGILTSEQ